MRTQQELVDHVITCLVAQGEPSVVGEGSATRCMYLAPDGKRCAAGWCVDEMPPELSSYESSWRAVPIAIREAVGHEALVRQLQRDHDNPAIGGRGLRVSEWRNAWRSNMSRTLANLNLDATVLTTLATDAWVANGPSK